MELGLDSGHNRSVCHTVEAKQGIKRTMGGQQYMKRKEQEKLER